MKLEAEVSGGRSVLLISLKIENNRIQEVSINQGKDHLKIVISTRWNT